jgi:GTP cyclohydrolase IA
MELSKVQRDKLNAIAGVELGILPVNRAVEGVESLIKLCGDDPERNGLLETPFRVVKAFLEYTQGYREDPAEHLSKNFDVNAGGLVLLRDIELFSMCEHHFAPFYGVAHVGYIPKEGQVTGLSKIARVVEGYSKRFQVQERLTEQIADAMQRVLDPKGVMVVVEAKHMCMCGRGIKKSSASTTTSSVRGVFLTEASARNEFLQLLR